MASPEVLFLDNHLLVVSKPPGMLAQADGTRDEDVVTWAKAYLKEKYNKPGNVFAGLVHRLDRPVGGVMVLARTSKSASRLADQFRQRTPEKRYLAMVEGRVDGNGRAEDWLLKTHGTKVGKRVKRVNEGTQGAKRAVLRWTALSIVGRRSLIEIELETGRAHQIRVQLSARGHPIVGDLRYGADTGLSDGRSLALHATRLTIEHPTLRDRRTFVSPPPTTWGGEFQDAIRRRMRDA